MEQLIVSKPSDPLAFLVEQLKKENDDGKYCISITNTNVFAYVLLNYNSL